MTHIPWPFNTPAESPSQGWQCPVCKQVMAPFMPYCPCGGKGKPSETVPNTSPGTPGGLRPPTPEVVIHREPSNTSSGPPGGSRPLTPEIIRREPSPTPAPPRPGRHRSGPNDQVAP